jgi:hypothetical protein
MENRESIDKGFLFYDCEGTLPDGTRCTQRYSKLNVPAYCEQCQTPTALSCLSCGKSIGARQNFCKGCGARQICAGDNCHARLTSPGKFCPHCSLIQQPSTAAPTTNRTPSGTGSASPNQPQQAPTPVPARELEAQGRFAEWYKDTSDFARRIDLAIKDDDARRFIIRPGTRALVYIASEQSDLVGQTSLDFFEIGGNYSDTREVTARMLMNRTGVGFRSGMPPVSILLLDAGRISVNLSVAATTQDNEEVEILVDVALEIESAARLLNLFGKADTIKRDAFRKTLSDKILPVLTPSTRETTYDSLSTLAGRDVFCSKVLQASERRLDDIGIRIADVAIAAVIPGDVRSEYQEKLSAIRGNALDHSALEAYLSEELRRNRIILAHGNEGLSLQKDSNAIEIQSITLDLDKELQINAVRISHDGNLARQESLSEETRKVRESLETGKLRTDTEELISRVDIETRRRTHLAILRGLDTDDKVGDFKEERRFQDYVRETERNLKLDALLSDAEIAELHRSIGNKQRYAQLVDDIALRNNIRHQELEEARHQVDLLAPARDGKLADAGLRQQLQVVDIAMQLESAALGRSIRDADGVLADVEARRSIDLSKLRDQLERDRIEYMQGLDERKSEHALELESRRVDLEGRRAEDVRRDKAHDAEIAMKLKAQTADADYRMLELNLKSQETQLNVYKEMTPEQLPFVTGASVDAIRAVMATRPSTSGDSENQKMLADFYRLVAEKAEREKEIELARLDETRKRDTEQHNKHVEQLLRAQSETNELIKHMMQTLGAVGVAAAGAGGSSSKVEVNPPQPVNPPAVHVHVETPKNNQG